MFVALPREAKLTGRGMKATVDTPTVIAVWLFQQTRTDALSTRSICAAFV